MSRLESGWHDLISGRSRQWWSGPARAGLSALSLPYAGVISSYRALFDFGVIRPERLPCRVLSVGNITVGGTGKTTTVRWLARRLQSWGARPAILSRGYRAGKSGDPHAVTIVAGPEGLREAPESGGDEPVLLARSLPGVPVLIGRKRVRSGRLACEQFHPDVLLLDDAFQYWRLQKDLEVLLLDATNPFGYGSVFPRGMLREPTRGIRRAQAAVLTHASWADAADRERLLGTLRKRMPGAVLAEARHVPVSLRDHLTGESLGLGDLRHGKWLAVSGLGRPGAFERTLGEVGAREVESAPFPDHHAYTPEDIRAVRQRLQAGGFAGLVTTEKDAVKLPAEWLEGVCCRVLEIDLEFLSGQEPLEALLRRRLTGEDRP